MRCLLALLIIFFCGLQYRLWIGEGSWANIVSLEKKLTEQKIVTQALEERNAVLAQEVFSLKNGYEAIEERARAELGMIKEGETFYLLINEQSKGKQ
jgi:cell division protein FtsB